MLEYYRVDLYHQATCIRAKKTERYSIVVSLLDTDFGFEGTTEEIEKKINKSHYLRATSSDDGLIVLSHTPGYEYTIVAPSVNVEIETTIEEDFYLIEPPPLKKHRLVAAYLKEFQQAILAQPTYPAQVDIELYPAFKKYYKKIFNLVAPELNPDDLAYRSRHSFLVGTEPITINEDNTQKTVIGLCGLAELMGYQMPFGEKAPVEPMSSTGDSILDVQADILLIFKSAAPYLIDNFGVEVLSRVAIQANARMKEAHDNAEKERPSNTDIISPPKEEESFAPVKAQILEKLKSSTIPVPASF